MALALQLLINNSSPQMHRLILQNLQIQGLGDGFSPATINQ